MRSKFILPFTLQAGTFRFHGMQSASRLHKAAVLFIVMFVNQHSAGEELNDLSARFGRPQGGKMNSALYYMAYIGSNIDTCDGN